MLFLIAHKDHSFGSRIQFAWVLLTSWLCLGSAAAAGTVCDSWVANGPYAGNIISLATDPSDADILYSGANLAIFKSTDGGSSWERASAGLEERGSALAIAVNPSSPNSLFAGFNGHLMRSDDGARSWQEVATGLVDPEVRAILFDPSAFGQIIFVAVEDQGVLKSVDGGASWSLKSTGFNALGLRSLAVDPVTPTVLYAGVVENDDAGRGAYKSTDSGETWSHMANGLANNVYSLAVDPSSPATVYAGTNDGPFKTIDGAASWTQQTNGFGSFEVIWSLIVDPTDPEVVYVGGDDLPFYKTVDGGALWTSSFSGMPAGAETRSLALAADGTLHAGLDGKGMFRSNDAAVTWTESNQGLTSTNIAILGLHPADPAVQYAGGSNVPLSKSSDAGLTWTKADSGIFGSLESFAIDPAGTAYVSTSSDVFKTVDGGSSWNSSGVGVTEEVLHLAIAPSASATLYAGARDVMFKSTNGGGLWIDITNSLPIGRYRPTVHPSDPDIVYTKTQSAMYRTVDGGASWSEVSAGLPTPLSVENIVIDPWFPETVLIATFGHGIFKTTNGGANWSPINAGLLTGPVWSLAIEPDTGRVVAGVGDGFIMESVDGGGIWNSMVEDLYPERARQLAFAPTGTGRLHAAASGSTHHIELDDAYEAFGSDGSDDACFGKTMPLGLVESRRHCDEDWVAFYGKAGLTYRVETSELSLPSDTLVSLQSDCNGIELASDDNSGVGLASKLDFPVLADGIFDVRIQQVDEIYGADKKYDVRIIVAPFFEDGFETGDSSAWSP